MRLYEGAAESVCWSGLPSQSFGAGCRVSLLEWALASQSVCSRGLLSQSVGVHYTERFHCTESPLHGESSLQGEGTLHGKLTEVEGCEILKYG